MFALYGSHLLPRAIKDCKTVFSVNALIRYASEQHWETHGDTRRIRRRETRLARELLSVQMAEVWVIIDQRELCVYGDVSRLELREDPLHFEPALLLTYSFFR